MAEAGEFSLRALANGRMDLAEAEAIRDLIDAQTVASARQAVRQLRGEFSHELQPIKDELLDVIVVLESALRIRRGRSARGPDKKYLRTSSLRFAIRIRADRVYIQGRTPHSRRT